MRHLLPTSSPKRWVHDNYQVALRARSRGLRAKVGGPGRGPIVGNGMARTRQRRQRCPHANLGRATARKAPPAGSGALHAVRCKSGQDWAVGGCSASHAIRHPPACCLAAWPRTLQAWVVTGGTPPFQGGEEERERESVVSTLQRQLKLTAPCTASQAMPDVFYR